MPFPTDEAKALAKAIHGGEVSGEVELLKELISTTLKAHALLEVSEAGSGDLLLPVIEHFHRLHHIARSEDTHKKAQARIWKELQLGGIKADTGLRDDLVDTVVVMERTGLKPDELRARLREVGIPESVIDAKIGKRVMPRMYQEMLDDRIFTPEQVWRLLQVAQAMLPKKGRGKS